MPTELNAYQRRAQERRADSLARAALAMGATPAEVHPHGVWERRDGKTYLRDDQRTLQVRIGDLCSLVEDLSRAK